MFYLRGGYDNNDGLVPLDPTPAIATPSSATTTTRPTRISRSPRRFAAEAVNAIANSPYWSQSAIIITYDETDGFYDHVSPEFRNKFADGSVLAAGPRIPGIVISPYAAGGTISHRYSEHGSVIKFINELKGLVPLAELPNEKNALVLGETNLGQKNIGSVRRSATTMSATSARPSMSAACSA